MGELSIRRAGSADLTALLGLVAQFYEVDGHRFAADRVIGGLEPLLCDDRRGQVWLAESAGTPAGYAVITWSWSLESGGLDCLLDELYVQERGAGHGGALLRHVMAAARDAGAAAVFLETEAPNDGARRFYRRHGFNVEDSVWLSAEL